MVNCECVVKICLILVIPIMEIYGRPQDGSEGRNKTKSRILSHPSKFEFGVEQEIVFPENSEENLNFSSRIGISPKCADGMSFCEEIDSYPYNHLKRVLRQNPMLKVFFGQDEAPQGIATRIGDDNERFVCRSTIKTVFPKIGQNINSKWKFIINQGEEDGFIQGVQIEVCRRPDEECDIPGTLLSDSGYKTYCKQKYVYRRMLSVSNEGSPIPDTFKVPSACCCAYKQNLNFLSRFGRGFSPTSRKS